MVRIDFETRSTIDLKECGAYIYAKHPSTQIMCIAFRVDDGPVYLWHPFPNVEAKRPVPKLLWEALASGMPIESHNVFFERCIWNLTATRQFGWPELPVHQLNCSAAKASAMALPRHLEGLGKALRTDVQKDMEGRRLMLKLSKPRKPTLADPTSKWHEKPDELNRLFAYCKDDVLAESAASKILVPLPPFEKKVWHLNQSINWRGVKCDRDGIESAMHLVEGLRSELQSELVGITGGLVTTHSQLNRILDFLQSRGESLPNLQAQVVDELLTNDQIKDPDARRVLEIRRLLSKSSVDKYWAMHARMSDDDRVRDLLVYHGASTGREAGQGIQIQNLPRGTSDNQNLCIELMKRRDLELFKTCYDKPMNAISSCIRGMIIADTGKILRAVDYSAIEARVLAWLAGEAKVIEIFKGHGLIYEAAASDIYKVAIDLVTKAQRQIGKVAVLALGYQGGVGAFQQMAKNYGVIVNDKEADAIKMKWREAHPNIVRFWYDLERAAFECVASKKTKVVRGLEFKIEGRFLTLRLPSGRKLFYCEPTIKQIETSWGQLKDSVHFWYVDSQTKQWVEGPIYGGLWCENVTQAVARDLLMDSGLKLQDNGYTPLFSVHDEWVTEDDLKFGSLKEIEQITTDIPAWANGLPIGVEGWESDRYRK